ncbi:MAG: periplasmic heavy metal sensor [Deltaproteobacteria bacterium]|nr:periplasmic heavy metal sensor [Deltaproteobacteria bacterium]
MRRWTILTLLPFLLLTTAAAAQPGPRGPGDPDRFERFREKRGALLRRKVGLTEPEAAAIEAIMDRGHEARMDLMDTLHEARGRVRQLLKEDSGDEEAFRGAMDEVLALRDAMHDLHTAEIAEIRAALSPKKAAKLLATMERVHRKMRGMRHGPGGPGGGGECPWRSGEPGPGDMEPPLLDGGPGDDPAL